jgi:hypothetical protein
VLVLLLLLRCKKCAARERHAELMFARRTGARLRSMRVVCYALSAIIVRIFRRVSRSFLFLPTRVQRQHPPV